MPEKSLSIVKKQETARLVDSTNHMLDNLTAIGLDSNSNFSDAYHFTDSFGYFHTRFEHYYKGVKVFGSYVVSHQNQKGGFAPDTLQLVSDGLNFDAAQLVPSISKSTALNAAKKHWGVNTSMRTLQNDLVLYPIQHQEAKAAKAEKSLSADDMRTVIDGYKLAYFMDISVKDGFGERVYVIDANTGTPITWWNNIQSDTPATGTGNSQYSGTISINTAQQAGGNYVLQDLTRGTARCHPIVGSICSNTTTDLADNYATNGGVGNIYQDNSSTGQDNTWGDGAQFGWNPATTATTSGQTAGVDAHYGMSKTWDMYKNVFNRNGIDDQGSAILTRVHYDYANNSGVTDGQYDNAFWSDGCFCMTYGDGDPTYFTSLTSLDVAGHEMAHGLTSRTARLVYSGESGGLNEATSDIFGSLVEFYARGASNGQTTIPNSGTDGQGHAANWIMGEQLGSPIRYMYKPSLDFSSADAWSSTLGNVDVHYSSGPMNRAFYFMAQGIQAYSSDTGTCAGPYGSTKTHCYSSSYQQNAVAGIGNDKAARIWYRALTVYLTPTSNYSAARTAALSAATDLYGSSSAEYQAVDKAFLAINVAAPAGATTTALTSSANPAATAAAVTFTATVTGSSPSGTIAFRDGGSSISGCSAVALSSGSATCTSSSLAAGAHSITAVYSGDSGNSTSTSSALAQVINVVTSSTTSLTSSANPASYGQSITLTATITGTTPTGTVQFLDGVSAISGCDAARVTKNKATCVTKALSVATHSLTAVYSGDSKNTTSTSSALSLQVTQVATTNTLKSSKASINYGQSATFTATLKGGTTLTGTVQFLDGGSAISGCDAVTVSANKATCTASSLAAGNHSVTAVYSGDTNNAASTSSAVTQQVKALVTKTALSTSAKSIPVGQAVTFTATVTGSGLVGTVAFTDNGSAITGCGAVTLSSNAATCTTSSLTVGSHSIVAAYSGDTNNAASTGKAVAQTVTLIPTLVTASSSLSASVVGETVTVTIGVDSSVGGVGTPSGTATIYQKDSTGKRVITSCTLTLSSGGGSCDLTGSTKGSYKIVAHYDGDGATFAAKDGAAIAWKVN